MRLRIDHMLFITEMFQLLSPSRHHQANLQDYKESQAYCYKAQVNHSL